LGEKTSKGGSVIGKNRGAGNSCPIKQMPAGHEPDKLKSVETPIRKTALIMKESVGNEYQGHTI